MKNYINIAGFCISQSNRGNAALNFGTLSFLRQKGYIDEETELIAYRFCRNPFKVLLLKPVVYNFNYEGRQWNYAKYPVSTLERWLLCHFHFIIPWTRFGKTIKKTKLAVADFGGDGFSDIYGQKILDNRYDQYTVISKAGIPFIILPQTIGPFQKKNNLNYAISVIKYAREVYVRDDKFTEQLKKLKVNFTRTPDLSSFMSPEPFDIEIKKEAIGLNVSGLAYFNNFPNLEGQFDTYPSLIDSIIRYFQNKGCYIYLIPHSYNYSNPVSVNDDMEACRLVYKRLSNKKNIFFVNHNLSAPQVKYVISKMNFFIGTRMHANFAAIYTGVPLFGLAYSYKFSGAFYANGLNGDKQTYMINNMSKTSIGDVINKIETVYNESKYKHE